MLIENWKFSRLMSTDDINLGKYSSQCLHDKQINIFEYQIINYNYQNSEIC